MITIGLRRQVGVAKTQGFQHQLVELRFVGTDTDMLAIRGFVGIVVMTATIQAVGLALFYERTRGQATEVRGHQRSCAFDHGCIHDLALSRTARFDVAGQGTHGHIQGAAAKSPTRFNGGTGPDAAEPVAYRAPVNAM